MKRFIGGVSLVLAWHGASVAQETSGHIRGRLESSAAPVASAEVTATSPDLLGSRRAVSAGDGVFTLLALPPGTYTLRIAAIGFRPLVMQEVRVQLGRTTGLGDIRMEQATVELDAITVVAPAVTLDPAHTTIGGILEAQDYSTLPGERDYTSLIAILPHINTSHRGDPVNAGGSTGLENLYFIDGVNVTAPIRADAGTRLPYNFVRVVEVRTGGYEAQYGRALGAIVNAVTYTGTNDFEASVFGFFTHSALAAESKAQATLQETGAHSYDVGARVSGPVIRDRLWFSAAYNPRITHADRDVAGLGTYADNSRADIFAGKLYWQASSALNVELSLFGDPTVHDAVTVPTGWFPASFTPLSAGPYLVRLETGGVVGSLRAAATLGRRVLLEASLARHSGRQGVTSRAAGGPTPLYVDYVTQSVDGGWPEYYDVDVGRSAAVLRATMNLGHHTVIAGVEYEDVVQTGTSGQDDIGRPATASWIQTVGDFPGRFHNRAPTAYLQNAWRITDRLTINAGVRWSAQTLTGARDLVAQRFRDEWQPRLGFIWQPGMDGRQGVFGSIGRFYQQEPLWLSGSSYGDGAFVTSFYSGDPRQPGPIPDSSAGGQYFFNPDDPYIEELAVEHSDEMTLGYERLAGRSTKLTARVIRRELRSSNQFGYDWVNSRFIVGTPGEGYFDYLPRARREYTALELAAEGSWRGLPWRASYVLSRTWGNYSGLFDSDLGVATPGGNRTFASPHQAINSTGLLPNDRTHVVKLSGSHRASFGLTTGIAFTWASGTPLNAFAPCPCDQPVFREFVAPRGSVGRTPSIWTLDVRLAYDVRLRHPTRSRIVLDVLNVGNPQGVVLREELRYLTNTGGVPSGDNPDFLRPIAFQPPMAARLGVEVSF